MATGRKICVGQFAGAHGVRGLVKLRSFTAEPTSIFEYAPLSDETGKRVFKITRKSTANDIFIATVEGITNKEDADDLRGDKIYIPRDVLPKPEKGEYYEADLVGLVAQDDAGKSYGTILAVHNHGAGTFVEIGTTHKDSFMLPFRDEFVPVVDADAGTATIIVPEGWLKDEKPT